MVWLECLLTAVVALVLSVALTAIFFRRRADAGPGFWLFFLLLFFTTWAGGLWLIPRGPALAGVHWMNFILVGLLSSLFAAALLPIHRWPPAPAPARTAVRVGPYLNLSFWLFVMLAFAGILMRHLYTDTPDARQHTLLLPSRSVDPPATF